MHKIVFVIKISLNYIMNLKIGNTLNTHIKIYIIHGTTQYEYKLFYLCSYTQKSENL